MEHPVVAWNASSSELLAKTFATRRGKQILRLAGALFRRFGLAEELDEERPGGAWFFESLPAGSGGVSDTVSELKWRIWYALSIHLLECPLPDAALGFMIASDYFRRHLPPEDLEKFRGTEGPTSTAGCYITKKFTKVLSEDIAIDATSEAEEEMVSRIAKVVELLPAPRLRHRRLLEALWLFDCTGWVYDLVHAWFLFQLGLRGKKETSEWLAAVESRANRDRLGNVLLFFLEMPFKSEPPDVTSTLEHARTLFTNAPRVVWKSKNLRPALRKIHKILELARIAGVLAYSDDISLEHWIQSHSQVHATAILCRTASWTLHSDVSELVGRLLYSWSRTSKGRRDHEELKRLCGCGAAEFVTHVKSTVVNCPRGSGEVQALCRAAGAVFGDKFGGPFVTLCACSAGWEAAVCLPAEELEKVRRMAARRGLFRVASLPSKNQWLGEMVLYLVHLVLEDRIQCVEHDRQTWIEDAGELLVSASIVEDSHPALEKESGVYYSKIGTAIMCREFEAWLYSPGTLEQLEASVEQMEEMMRRAAADDLDGPCRDLMARMAGLFGDDEDVMHARIIMHGMEAAAMRRGEEVLESKRKTMIAIPLNRRLRVTEELCSKRQCVFWPDLAR